MRNVEYDLRCHLLTSSTNAHDRLAELLSKLDLCLNPVPVVHIHPGDQEEATALPHVFSQNPAERVSSDFRPRIDCGVLAREGIIPPLEVWRVVQEARDALITLVVVPSMRDKQVVAGHFFALILV